MLGRKGGTGEVGGDRESERETERGREERRNGGQRNKGRQELNISVIRFCSHLAKREIRKASLGTGI